MAGRFETEHQPLDARFPTRAFSGARLEPALEPLEGGRRLVERIVTPAITPGERAGASVPTHPCYPWYARDQLLDPLRRERDFVRFMEALERGWRAAATKYGSAIESR